MPFAFVLKQVEEYDCFCKEILKKKEKDSKKT